VLQVLDRTHDPARVGQAVRWARDAGFEQVSLDLIYGTPGESVADWQTSIDAALACAPDHVSAYSLIVEDGTRLARQVRAGVVPTPDDDDLADKYVLADDALSAAGLEWYEVSNWARDAASRCRHNELYWTSASWWGVGPGAHSHVAGERWWNVKHPSAYAARIASGEPPAQDGEVLDEPTRAMERVLLEIRLRSGLPADVLDETGHKAAAEAVARGAHALDPRGELYSEDNVRERLAMRNLMQALRSGGELVGGPAAFKLSDRHLFANQLDRFLARSR
jgi:oxygen-independent coproporphyrinogen-3 oxidase